MTEPAIDITELRRALAHNAEQTYKGCRWYASRGDFTAAAAHATAGTYGWAVGEDPQDPGERPPGRRGRDRRNCG